MSRVTRREAVKCVAGAAAGFALSDAVIRGQAAPIRVAGKPVEFVVSSISDATVRITALPLAGGRIPPDDSLVQAAGGRIVVRRSSADAQAIHAGQLSIRFTSAPPSIHIETLDRKTVQRLTLDASSSDVSFLLGKGPLLGMGEGGPQFDRKGAIDRGQNGQGVY